MNLNGILTNEMGLKSFIVEGSLVFGIRVINAVLMASKFNFCS
jgi:hypothetical protein